ncbi:hypothetical protein GC176_08225 [bacterium]|nr:hypothetical protein [bacterium]
MTTFLRSASNSDVPYRAAWHFHAVLLLLLTAAFETGFAANAADVPPIRFLREWGQQGDKPGEFHFPIAIAINSADEVLVTDHLNSRVQKFDRDGNALGHFTTLGNPGGIALDESGQIYLTHIHASGQSDSSDGDFVTVCSPTGELLRRWGKTGNAAGEFDCPGGLAVSKDGRVFVADQTNRRVQVFDRNGTFLRQWGEFGNEPGQFGGKAGRKSRVGGPQFVACDASGNVWTTEGANCRVQSFTPMGKPLTNWGSDEDRPGCFGGFFTGFDNRPARSLVGPIALCFDQSGRLWISAVSGRVQQFTADGQYLRGLTNTQGTEPGHFFAPHGLAFNSAGQLYIVDSYNHRIQKFEVGP